MATEHLSSWALAAQAAGYAVHQGLVYHGAGGYVLAIPEPEGFGRLNANVRPMVAQALIEYVCNRVGQVASKAKDATRNTVQAAVNDAMTKGYDGQSRDKNIVADDVAPIFRRVITEAIEAAGKTADTRTVDATVGVFSPDGERYKAGRTEFWDRAMGEALTAGTYTVREKGKKAETGAAADL